tara:strand:+ start:128 stop:340 length:213 start_codon:yes stop_codon:yes gene_type:complete
MIINKATLLKEKLAEALPLHEKIEEQLETILSLHARINRMEERQRFSDAKILELLRAIEMKDKHAKGLRK